MRISRRMAVAAAAVVLPLAVAACSGASSGSSGSSAPQGRPQHGGTVTIAWPATPNFVFPLVPATNSDGFNENLSSLLWPFLVYPGDGAQSIVNPRESLFTSIAYSDGDRDGHAALAG